MQIANGNIISLLDIVNPPGGEILETAGTYSYQTGTNKLTHIAATPAFDYGYDANGNITSENTRTLVYDLSNQLIQVLDGGIQTATYTYNGAGQRIKKVTQTETRIFHYDLKGHLISETTQAGQMLAEYIYLGDQLLSMIKPGEIVYYFHSDHLGTPQLLTDDTQAIAWKATYTPFGKAVTTIATVDNPFRFPGQYYDQETGLHYNYFRYYNPQTARYITPDPIGLEGGINLFTYTNNPVKYMDPYGLSMVLIDIKRGTATQISTPGTLTVNYMNIGYTLELPDRGNQQWISRIPEGTYFGEVWNSPEKGLTIRLRDVPYREDILIHVGNYASEHVGRNGRRVPSDTSGCILPGKSKARDFVGYSGDALNEILGIIDFAKTVDKALGQPTDIVIHIH